MKIKIEGEKTMYEEWQVEYIDWDNAYNLPSLECVNEDGERAVFLVARDDEEAGEAAREYWRNLAETDPREFARIVGEDTLISWALGQYAGPGYEKVRSLEEWLDVVAENAEEELATYDHWARGVEEADEELEKNLGFRPTVAFRTD
jgi:hypothetical protein